MGGEFREVRLAFNPKDHSGAVWGTTVASALCDAYHRKVGSTASGPHTPSNEEETEERWS